MAHLKRINGHLLTQNAHLSTCCCYICTCTSSLKSSYTIDFGAGGWTDDGCDYCDQVAGDFVIGGLSSVSCCAEYEDSPVCTYADSCESIKTMYFHIDLCLQDAGGGQLKWYVQVYISLTTIQNPSCPDEEAIAVYESDPFDPTDCNVVPVTLNKISETLSGGVCGGNLPATITLDET